MNLQNLQLRKLTFQEEKETEGGCDPTVEAVLRALRAVRYRLVRPIYGFIR